MKRKLIACFFAVVMLMAFSSVSIADSISNGDQVYLTDGAGNVGAGIFHVWKKAGTAPIFDTFCLERTEYISLGSPNLYTVHIDTFAVGGAGGAEGGKDYISNETAYLYYKFRTGAYKTANEDAMSALQVAFWILEDEYLTSSNVFAQSIEDAAAAYIEDANGKWQDIGNVRVMNLYDAAGAPKQSQLTLVPEPASMLLFGLGLLGLAGLRRKLKK